MYRFKKNTEVNFRLIDAFIVKRLRRITEKRVEKSTAPRCFVLDDTDREKTGRRFELLSKIYSHVKKAYLYGFKQLTLGYHDGKCFFGLDFSLHGEPGQKQ